MKRGLTLSIVLGGCVLLALFARTLGTRVDDLGGQSLGQESNNGALPPAADLQVGARKSLTSEEPQSSRATPGTVRVEARDRLRGDRIAAARVLVDSKDGRSELPILEGAVVAPAALAVDERLIVEATGYFAQGFSASEWNDRVGGLEVGAPMTIELAPLGSLVILARDGAGKVASGVSISLRPHFSAPTELPYGWRHDGEWRNRASPVRLRLPSGNTDADGRLALDGLPTDEELEIKWGGSVQPGRVTCRIAGALGSATLEIIVNRGVSVRGRFVDRLGAPLEKLKMRVRLDCTRDRLEVLLQGDGRFVFAGVSSGPARLAPLFPDAQTFALQVGMVDIDLGDVQLVPAPAQISGRVIAPEGTSLVLMVMGQRGDLREIILGKSPTFSVWVAEGPLQLAVRRNGGEVLAQVACVAPASDVVIEVDVLDGRIRFGLPNGAEPTSVFLETSESRAQRAIDHANGILALKIGYSAGQNIACTSLGDGYYEARAVEPGLYTVHVITKSLAACSIQNVRVTRGEFVDLGWIGCDHSVVASSSDSGGRYLVFPLAGDKFSMGPGESRQVPSGMIHWMPERIGAGTPSSSSKLLLPGERLELPPLSITGRIVGHALAAFPAAIELRPHGYGGGVPESALQRVMLDSSGEFTFDEVEPGPCALCLLPLDGGPHLEVPVLVSPGETARVELLIGNDSRPFEFMRANGALRDVSIVDLYSSSDGRRYRGSASDGKCYAPIVDDGVYLVAVGAPSLGYLGEGLNEPVVLGELRLGAGASEPAKEYRGTLDVALAPTALRPPIASLLTWNGKQIRVWGIARPALLRERITAAHYRFVSIPDEAEIELTWMDSIGHAQRQEVSIRGGAPQRVVLE